MAHLSTLLTLTLSACTELPEAQECAQLPLPDAVATDCDDDLDGDGITNCDDGDADGDGLRNDWDAVPDDGDVAVPPAGGLCDDGDLHVTDTDELASFTPKTWLSGDVNAGSTTVPVEDATGFKEGDEILILYQQGAAAGTYEWVYVAGGGAGVLTIEPRLLNSYDASSDPLARVLVQRVPHFNDVSVEGTLNVSDWDSPSGGGVLMFRACGTVDISGTLDASAVGFAGGDGVAGNDGNAFNGESWIGPSTLSVTSTEVTGEYPIGANNGGGGGAPVIAAIDDLADQLAGGGGGSYGTVGQNGTGNDGELLALAGEVYGTDDLSTWFIGSGGGGGGPDTEEDDGDSLGNLSGTGGAGGGVVTIFAAGSITIPGAIDAAGGMGQAAVSVLGEVGGGGGGSGGQIFLVSPLVSATGTVSVKGGVGGWPASDGAILENEAARGGGGGDGRIRVDAIELQGADDDGTLDGTPIFDGDFDQWYWGEDDPFVPPCDTDADADGSLAWDCGGPDCDDSDPTVNPGASDDAADGIDQNCDGADACADIRWVQGGIAAGCATAPATGSGALQVALSVLVSLVGLVRRRR